MKIELKQISGDWRCIMSYKHQSFLVGDGLTMHEAKFTKRMLEIAFEHYEADKKRSRCTDDLCNRHKFRSQQ